MTAEPAFLIAAVRRFLHPEAPLPNLEKIDWTTLLRLADAHAVTPMLYEALRGVSIPDTASQNLHSAVESSIRWSLAQSGELVRLAGLLQEREIPMVSLKGPLLSQYLYGDLGSRSSGDIDVLVKREDVLGLRDVLVSNGYRLTSTLHWNSDSACLRSRENEISFESPSGVSIDVHWRLVPWYFASVFDELNGWESLRTVTVAGQKVQTLAPEPLLLFLCAHGAKHLFGRLGWICDVARFLVVTPNLTWTELLAEGPRARSLRQLLLGINLAADLLGSPSPSDLPTDQAVRSLASTIRNGLLGGEVWPGPAAESTRQTLQLLESPWHRLRYLTGQFLTPSEAEYGVLRLPPWLYYVYYPFRPVRLIWKHVVRALSAHRV